ncbi:MAG: hypothetical protein IH612_04020 [Desulfofustis sp.]|nr:hypothetical protein [Desulfofustis sp.]
MAAKKKGAGGNLTRTQVVTVRLDPKLRYLAELAALKQRRTLSSYIEWAVQDSLSRVYLFEGTVHDGGNASTVHDEADTLWDVYEPDRFIKLAFRYPELLTHEEQIKWKLIRENGYLWKGKTSPDSPEWTWQVDEKNIRLERVRESWEVFCRVAAGKEDPSFLPKWTDLGHKPKDKQQVKED